MFERNPMEVDHGPSESESEVGASDCDWGGALPTS
jgi:hypothetical protein